MKAATIAIFFLVAVAPSAVSAQSRAAGLTGNPGQFFGPDAYPAEALAAQEQGRVIARLDVDPTGHVTGCTVSETSGSASLDKRTCEIALARVVFTPARDERGRSIRSTYTLPVRWVLPQSALLRLSSDETVRVDLDANDRVTGCRFTRNGNDITASNGFCAGFTGAPTTVIRNFTGGRTGRPARVTIQRIIQFGGQPRLPQLRAVAGETIVRLIRVSMSVPPDGTRADVRTVEDVGTTPPLPNPATALDDFVATPGRTDTVEVTATVAYKALP